MSAHSSLDGSDLHIARAKTGNGSPVSVIIPTVIGLFYYDLVAQKLWIAVGLTNADWVLV